MMKMTVVVEVEVDVTAAEGKSWDSSGYLRLVGSFFATQTPRNPHHSCTGGGTRMEGIVTKASSCCTRIPGKRSRQDVSYLGAISPLVPGEKTSQKRATALNT